MLYSTSDFQNPTLAFPTLVCTAILTALTLWQFGSSPFIYVTQHYLELITASLMMSVLQACYCYWSSFRSGRILALGGNSGHVIYDVRLPRLFFLLIPSTFLIFQVTDIQSWVQKKKILLPTQNNHDHWVVVHWS